MPVLDWTRTDLTRRWPDGSEALAYDADDLAAFDLFILKREGAEKEYEASALARTQAIFEKMTEKDKNVLQQNIIAGLPGRMVEAYTVEEFRDAVAQYKNVSTTQIRENLAYFLKSIIPTCEEAGVYMAIHPDDPPRPILGLPPACSTRDDVAALLKAADSKHNGITLCVGTYASSPQNKASMGYGVTVGDCGWLLLVVRCCQALFIKVEWPCVPPAHFCEDYIPKAVVVSLYCKQAATKHVKHGQASQTLIRKTRRFIPFCHFPIVPLEVEEMAKEFASRTHFVHLRNVTKEMPPAPETGLGPAGCTFTESDHLGGDVDMYSIMLTMLQEKQRRKAEGWEEMAEIPFRPDHGHKMVDDMNLGRKWVWRQGSLFLGSLFLPKTKLQALWTHANPDEDLGCHWIFYDRFHNHYRSYI